MGFSLADMKAQALGERWESTITFISDVKADRGQRGYKQDTIGELLARLPKLQLKQVSVWSTPLVEKQPSQEYFHHFHMEFNGGDGTFWALEKDYRGLWLRRAANASDVHDKWHYGRRITPIEKVVEMAGKVTLKELIEWVGKSGELASGYTAFSITKGHENNCVSFATKAFQFATKTDWEPPMLYQAAGTAAQRAVAAAGGAAAGAKAAVVGWVAVLTGKSD